MQYYKQIQGQSQSQIQNISTKFGIHAHVHLMISVCIIYSQTLINIVQNICKILTPLTYFLITHISFLVLKSNLNISLYNNKINF